MCVNHGRAALFDRASFFGAITATAAPLVLGATAMAEAADVTNYPLPAARTNLSQANARAARIAAASPFVRATYSKVEAIARTITDEPLRASILAFLRDPTPVYAQKYPTLEARTEIRDQLARAGFIKPSDPVSGIFPAGTEVGGKFGVQPFWATPGSTDGSHHAYPGGLAVHEYFNSTMALTFANTYDRVYFDGKSRVDHDQVVGAALYHDIMKAVVFQYNEDGTLFDELTIAGTGGHHILSAAEALVHGRSAKFVTTLLSAHAAPSLGDEKLVVAWARAAAIVAGIDPVAYGLLKKDGSDFSLAVLPTTEAFVNHLSDHDYVLSVHAMHEVSTRLRTRYDARPAISTFPWYRSAVLSQEPAIALYDVLTRNGEAAFASAVARVESRYNLGF
jgi:hypothetical protein